MDLPIFAPNSHSVNKISWKPVSTELRGFIANLLEREYGISSIQNIEKVDAWEVRSNNFKITYVDGGVTKQVLLRKNIQHATREAITAIDEVVSHLKAQGLKVAESLPTQNGNRCVESEGALWQLSPFISGNYFEGTKGQLIEAGSHIAKLHQALSTLVPSENLKALLATRPDKSLGASELQGFLDKAKGDSGECSSLLKTYADFLLAQVAEVENLYSVTRSSKQIIHADLHPHNLLFEGDTLTAILDLGDVRMHHRAMDVAGGAHRLVRQFIVRENKEWKESAKEGLALFWDSYSSIFPLPEDEFRAMLGFMKMTLLRKLQGTLTNYYGGKEGWTDKLAYGELLKQITLLHEAVAFKEFA